MSEVIGTAASHATGQWLRNGTTFYLQNVSDGLPLAVENTLATVTIPVRVTSLRFGVDRDILLCLYW